MEKGCLSEFLCAVSGAMYMTQYWCRGDLHYRGDLQPLWPGLWLWGQKTHQERRERYSWTSSACRDRISSCYCELRIDLDRTRGDCGHKPTSLCSCLHRVAQHHTSRYWRSILSVLAVHFILISTRFLKVYRYEPTEQNLQLVGGGRGWKKSVLVAPSSGRIA